MVLQVIVQPVTVHIYWRCIYIDSAYIDGALFLFVVVRAEGGRQHMCTTLVQMVRKLRKFDYMVTLSKKHRYQRNVWTV